MLESAKNFFKLSQEPNQAISSYYNKWIAAVEVFEDTYGTLSPKQIGSDTEAEA